MRFDVVGREAEPFHHVALVFGAVGDDSRLEYTVIGDAVNLAAKLENHCKVEGRRAVISGEALALAQAQGADTAMLSAPATRDVAGLAEPVAISTLKN